MASCPVRWAVVPGELGRTRRRVARIARGEVRGGPVGGRWRGRRARPGDPRASASQSVAGLRLGHAVTDGALCKDVGGVSRVVAELVA